MGTISVEADLYNDERRSVETLRQPNVYPQPTDANCHYPRALSQSRMILFS
jgi:hypothetical protein